MSYYDENGDIGFNPFQVAQGHQIARPQFTQPQFSRPDLSVRPGFASRPMMPGFRPGMPSLPGLPGMPGQQGGMIRAIQAGNRIPLGFQVIHFENGAPIVVTQESSPQRPVSPKRIVCSITREDCDEIVTITSIRVGADEILPSGDPLPAEMFSPSVQDGGLSLLTAAVGNTISITVACENEPAIGDHNIWVSIGMFCDVVG